VPKLAHPTKNNIDNGTSPSKADALAETPDKQSGSFLAPICPTKNPSVSLVYPLCELPSSSCSSLQFQLLPSPSAFLVVRQFQLFPTVPTSALCVIFLGCSGSSRQFRLFSGVLASPFVLCVSFLVYSDSSDSFGCSRQFRLLPCVSAFLTAALILPSLSLPLFFCIHCPSAATLITLSTSSTNPVPES